MQRLLGNILIISNNGGGQQGTHLSPGSQAVTAQQCRFWTESYAISASECDDDAKVTALTEMGFGRELCVTALARAKGDQEAALELLLTGAT